MLRRDYVGLSTQGRQPVNEMQAPRMKTPSLATVYLDNEVVSLMGDPCPSVGKVVAASGKRPESVQVLRAGSASDLRGKPVELEETLDRTSEPTKAIYLTCRARPKITGIPVELPDVEEPTGSPIPSLPSNDDVQRSPLAPLPREGPVPAKEREHAAEDWRIPPSRGESKGR